MAIVLARTNRADHVDARIARIPGNLARTLYEQTPQSMVLGCLALIPHARRHAIHVYLANHRLVRHRRQLVRMCGNKSANGQRQAQKAGDLAFGRHPLQKAFTRHRRLVSDLIKRQFIQVGTRGTDLAIANLAHRRTVTPSSQAVLNELTQVGLLVAHHDVIGAKVADHAADAAERRRHHDVVGQHIEQFFLGIGAPLAALIAAHQTRALDERARVDLDLVGHKGPLGHKALVVALVPLGRGAQQVEHKVRVDLKAKQTRKRKRPLDLSHRNTTLVDIEQMLVETLNTHLDLGAAQAADERKRLRRYGIGARLDNEPHHAMLRRLVDALLTLKLLHRCRLPLGDLAPRRTGTVQTTHRTVIAAHGSIHTPLLVGNAAQQARPRLSQCRRPDSAHGAPLPQAAGHRRERHRADAPPRHG